MIANKIFILLILLLFSSSNGYGQVKRDTSIDINKGLVLNYSFLDLPFAIRAGKTVNSTISNPNANISFFRGMQYFSMEQSMQIPTNIINSVAYGINKIPIFKKRPILKKISDNLISFFAYGSLSLLPYGHTGWTHEEWHRAVMVNSYTNSYNPFTFSKKDMKLGNAVSSVLDENLVMMKETDNPNFVRMSTAGIEGNTMLIEKLQQQNFFYNSDLPINMMAIVDLLYVQGYIAKCGDKDILTRISSELIELEKESQEQRDFTGYDLGAWAYDLFNPDVPYSARGIHKYGNGYDRYIYGDKLTDEQYNWLKKQANLSYLNFISPAIFFFPALL